MTQSLLVAAIPAVLAGGAFAGPSYLTQMRFVEAKVDAGGDMTEMERRVSMNFDTFDRSASAALEPGKSAAVSQTSTFGENGVTAAFSGALSALGSTPVTSTIRTVLEATFVLDGPHSFEFFPYGSTPSLVSSGSGSASLTGDSSVVGPDIDVSLAVSRGTTMTSMDPVSGTLAGGTYTFKYEFLGSVSDAELEFAFGPSLLFSPAGTGEPIVDGPAVIPLPSAALAGFGTLAGLGVVGRLRKTRRA